MKRRTKVVLVIACLAVVTTAATVVALTAALARAVDPHEYCTTGFSPLVSCKLGWSSRSIGHSDPIFAAASGAPDATSSPRPALQPTSVDVTSWAIADCPVSSIGRRLLCPVPSAETSVEAASDDLATGLPRPKPWLLTTARNSPFLEAVRVETPLGLAAALGFYRGELGKRGWTEDGVAVVEPDSAEVAFTTSSGPALLRLIRRNDRTVAELSLRKSAAANAELQPAQGQVRLLFGNTTDAAAVITINAQTFKLEARAGRHLTENAESGRKAPDGAEINLPPGKYKVALQVAGGAAQTSEFAVAADETWGLLVGPDGVALPMRLY
ncbi:hypothetical protein [Bradyrhizobium mercantei]|uniref:hypothetical protein n=1 Tax=Bradyrhizobium mercantei TaxID=1904807 RepID=UPI001177A0BA|nr:hypothetical protein [Bradyrhizobium mercantei]